MVLAFEGLFRVWKIEFIIPAQFVPCREILVVLGENLGGTHNLDYAMSRKASQKWYLTKSKGEVGIN